MMYPRKRTPTIVAHRVNSRWKIRYYISSPVIDTIEIDVIKSPQNDNIVLQHMDEDEFVREFVINNDHRSLYYDSLPRKIIYWITHRVYNGVKTKRCHTLYDVFKLIEREIEKKKKKEMEEGIPEKRVNVMIDLKAKGVADKLAEIIRSTKFNGTIYITSKYHKELVKVKRLVPHVKVLASFDGEPINIAEYLGKIGVNGASVRAAFVDKDLVNELHRHGYIIAVWTVNDLEMAKYLANLGVDMIITDIPEIVKEELEKEEELKAMQDEIDLDKYAEYPEDKVIVGGLEHILGYEFGHSNGYSGLRRKKSSR